MHIQRRVAAAVQGPLPPPLDAAPPSDVGGLKVEVWVRQEVVPCERESGNISAFSYGQTGAWMERIRAQCDSPKSTTGVSRASQVSECARSSSVKHDTRAERKGGVGGTAHPRRKREGDAVRADPLQRGLTRGPGPRLLDVVPVPVVGHDVPATPHMAGWVRRRRLVSQFRCWWRRQLGWCLVDQVLRTELVFWCCLVIISPFIPSRHKYPDIHTVGAPFAPLTHHQPLPTPSGTLWSPRGKRRQPRTRCCSARARCSTSRRSRWRA